MNAIKILLLEDDPLDADLIQAVLEEGLEQALVFEKVENRSDFLARIADFEPDVILSDYSLPHYSGLEACHDLQALESLIPFIIVTGAMNEETAAETIKAGAWDYVVKERLARLPVAVEHALERFESILEKNRTEERLANMQALLSQTQSIARVGGWEYDVALRKMTWTDEVYNIYGVDPKTYDPNDLEKDISFYAPGDLEEVKNAFWQTVEEGKSYDMELAFHKATGEKLWIRTGGYAEIIDDKVTRVYGYIMDSTDLIQADQNLRESEERYRALVEHSQLGVLVVGGDFKFSYANDKMCEILGRDLNEVIDHDFREFLDAESKILVGERYIQRQRGEDVPSQYEFNIIRKNGQLRRIEISSAVVNTSLGEVLTIAQLKDITDQRLAEQTLAESEARYRLIYETTPVAILEEDFTAVKTALDELRKQGIEDINAHLDEQPELIDQLGDLIAIKDVNQQTVQMFGAKDKEELLGSLDKISTPETRDIIREEIYAILEGKTYFEGETVNQTLQGKRLDVFLTMNLSDEAKGLDRVLVSMIDITTRKEAEHKLEQEKNRAQKYLNIAGSIIISMNAKGDLVLINQKGLTVLGYTHEEAIGKNWINHFLPTSIRGEVKDVFNNLMQGKVEPFEYHENPILTKNGSERTIAWYNTLVQDGNGRNIGILSSGQDITELKRGSVLLETLNQAALAMEKALTPQEIHTAIAAELKKINTECIIMHLDRDCSQLSIQFLSFDSSLLKAAETLTGLSQKSFTFPVDKVEEYRMVIEDQETVFIDNPVNMLRQILPEPISGLAAKISNFINIPKAIAAPLVVEKDIIGLFTVNSSTLSEKDIPNITAFANQIAAAWHRAQLFEQAQKRLVRLKALQEIDQAISGSLDLTVTLEVLIEKMIENLEVDAGVILLNDPDLQVLEYVTGSGFKTDMIKKSSARLGEGLTGRIALRRESVFIPDLSIQTITFDRARLIKDEDFVSYLGVPLIAKGNVLGVLEVFHRSEHNPTPEWFDFMETLAGQAAIAIDQLNLFNDLQLSNIELKRAYSEVIAGWSRALELRDQETEGHSRRVAGLAIAIAKEMGIRGEELSYLSQGALLHDIGKMGIPDAILLKPGKLTEEEWDIMKKHPIYSYQMLSPINHLKPALDIPYCHHERWDGTGYPRGLKGEEIPIAARIFALVDVWDALRSDRPYRKAWADDKVIAYIKDQSGAHFDPLVVEIFMGMIDLDELGAS